MTKYDVYEYESVDNRTGQWETGKKRKIGEVELKGIKYNTLSAENRFMSEIY